MSLSLALQNAISGLNASQKNLSVISNNIANANTDGYTRKTVDQSALYIDQQPSGVLVEGISRKVDDYLLRANRYYTSQSSRSQTIADFYERLQIYLGEPGTDNSLNAQLDLFFNAIRDLADNPESASIRQSAVNSGANLAVQVSSLASSIEDLRFQAEQEIKQSVDRSNQIIDRIFSVNAALNNSVINNLPDPGLLDERDSLLLELSQYMDIKTFYKPSGAVNVYVGPGVSLVDVERYQLVYNPATNPDTLIQDSTLSAISVVPVDSNGAPVGEPEEIATSGKSSEVTTVLTAGKLKALLEMRDTELPNILAQLDELAATMRDSFNAIHNDGIGYPPPASLTGTRFVYPDQYTDWQGEFRMVVVTQNGRPIDNPFPNENGGVRELTLELGDLDLGLGKGRLTPQDIADEINARFGPQQPTVQVQNLNDIKLASLIEDPGANLDYSFDLDLENISDKNAQIRIMNVVPSTGAVTFPAAFPTSLIDVRKGEQFRTGMDSYFNVQFGAAGPAIRTIDVTVEVTDEDGVITTATIQYTINTTATQIKNDRYSGDLQAGYVGTAGEQVPTSFSRFARAYFVDEEGNALPDGEPGYLKVEVEEPDLYGLGFDEMTSRESGVYDANPVVVGTNRGFSHFFELNNFFARNPYATLENNYNELKNSAINFAVEERIINNPNLIATGEIIATKQPADPASKPIYTFEIGAGGNQVATRLAALARESLAYSAAGSLPSTSKPLADYASDIIGSASSKTLQAEANASKDATLAEGFKNKSDAVSGVNIDEELANTILYQNAYTASAKVITVTNELFDALMQAF